MKTCDNSSTFPLIVVGKVVKGFGRGSKELGIPTANIDPKVVKNLPIENGVYYGFAQVIIEGDNDSDSMKNPQIFEISNKQLISKVCFMCCSCGYNPFYNNQNKSLEVHIMADIGMNLYDATMRIAICGKIRDEKNYDSLEELKAAIDNDIKMSREKLQESQWTSVKHDKNIFIYSLSSCTK